MARRNRRLSNETAGVLEIFRSDPGRTLFGLEVIRLAGIASGSLYPILHRLEERGLLKSSWEPLEDAIAAKRRPRRMYSFNAAAAELAEELLDERRAPAKRPRRPFPKVAPN